MLQDFRSRHLLLTHHPPSPTLLPHATTSATNPHGRRHRRHRRLITLSASTTNPIPNLPDAAVTAFQDYQLLFSSQPAESSDPLPLPATEGVLPPDFPHGTYYLIGPGMTADGHGSTVSPFDGHGYLRAFRFGANTVMYSARYVETEAAKEEREKETGEWRFRRPGHFSMLKARKAAIGVSSTKNVANTTVLSWGGRLFCLWEGSHPYEIEPTSLATVGPADLIRPAVESRQGGGAGGGEEFTAGIAKHLLHRLMGMPPKRTLSHYKIDARRNRLLVLSCDIEDMFLPNSTFTFYEFDSNFEQKQKKEFQIPDQLMIHDWAFTDSHYILTGNRIKLNVPGTLLAVTGLAPVISTVSLNPSQSTTPIYLLPRFGDNKTPKRNWRIPVEAPLQLWTSHVGNAFEVKDGSGNVEIRVQASVCSYQWFNFKKMFGYDWRSERLDPSFMNAGKQNVPHLVQISMVLNAEGTCRSCTIANSSSYWNKPADFPIINPINSGQSNRFIYASSTSGSRKLLPHFPYDSVIKLDCSDGSVKSWCPGDRSFIGEPMFVPKKTKDEEDGYIIVVEYAVFRQRCYLVVLDAKKIGHDDAVIVKLEVPEHLTFPLGFHGFWDGK